MFANILNITTETLDITNSLICIFSALILGLIIALTYMSSGVYTKNFVVTLTILPVLVQIVIMLVNGNLGTGIAVMGAFSLVRFRSIPGSSKDISFIFFAMAVGLSTGTGYITFAIVTTIILCIVYLILFKTSFGEKSKAERNLRVTIPESLDYTKIFDDLFEKYTKVAQLDKVKTTNLGSMYELHYKIVLNDMTQEKLFIDDIRCRNGNLTIICSRNQSQTDEL